MAILLVASGCASGPSLTDVHVDALSTTTGPLAGGTELTLTGTGLDVITSVNFGDMTAPVEDSSAESLTVVTPAAADFADGDVDVSVSAGGASSGTGLSFTYELSPLWIRRCSTYSPIGKTGTPTSTARSTTPTA
jgi:hypothetical protein